MKRLSFVLVLVALAGVVSAQNLGPKPESGEIGWGLAGLRVWKGFVPSGADFQIGWYGLGLVEGANTVLYAKAGGGYENRALVRDETTGEPVLYEDGEFFDSPNFQWDAGLVQGVLGRDDGANLLEIFIYYRGRYDINRNDLPEDVFPDVRTLFGTSFIAGIGYDSTSRNDHAVKSGALAEASLEWGPGALNAGKADFLRANAKGAGFLPLFDLDPDAEKNLFAGYLAAFASVDYALGDSVPIYVNQSFGGRDIRGSLGDCVRGYRWTTYDTELKLVGNLEARFVGPALVRADLLPTFYVFADAGYFSGYADATAAADESGPLASVGAGLAIDFLKVAQVGAFAAWRLVEDDFDPDARFNWGIKLFLHF